MDEGRSFQGNFWPFPALYENRLTRRTIPLTPKRHTLLLTLTALALTLAGGAGAQPAPGFSELFDQASNTFERSDWVRCGEQFAAADAVGKLRAVRKLEKGEELVALSGADPLNLVGILTPEARVPALAGNRVLLRDGIAIAAVEGGKLRRLAESELSDDALHALARRFHWRPLDPHLRSATAQKLSTLERTRDRVMNLPWSQNRR